MIDETLIMIPGPTPVHDTILAELGRPTPSHLAPSFVERFAGCLEDLKRIGRADAAHPFVVGGAGTLGMEMALVNLLAPGEELLVLSQGYFGDRFEEVAASFGIACDVVRAEWGTTVAPEELARRIAARRYAAVAMTHVDTSTGAAVPVSDYCELLRDRDELVILDGVCATGGMDERFDEWGLDVLLTGAQKALGAPPGVAILLVSERAMARRRARESCPAYYADLLRWQPVMEDPRRYFSTPAVNEIAALAVATRLVLDEGLERRFARHGRIARAVRAGVGALGFELFTSRPDLADTLSVLRYPRGLDDGSFRAAMASEGVVIAGALGPIAGQACRIGHMGNIDSGEVCRLLRAMEHASRDSGLKVETGASLSAAGELLSG
jgi:aspartate aminotransferase-like enzyme